MASPSGEFVSADQPQEDQLGSTAQTSNAKPHSVSAPLASGQPSSSMIGLPSEQNPLPTTPSEERKAPNNVIVRSNSAGNSISAGYAGQQVQHQAGQKYVISEESWKHHAQARAILSNLIGPNGEQLSSSDPYNTTVFVGGLSPLISEDTLRTFFVPFGEIHYVSCDLTRGSSIAHLLPFIGQGPSWKKLRLCTVH
jgi:hypothetical protein